MTETIELYLRIQAPKNTEKYELLKYLKNRPIPATKLVLEAIQAFYLPLAYLDNEEINNDEKQKIAKNSSSVLKHQAEYIEQRIRINSEVLVASSVNQSSQRGLKGKSENLQADDIFK